LTAESAGFKKHVQEGVTVGTNQRLTVDIPLQLGAQAEAVGRGARRMGSLDWA
jgi:hypothetical protein